MSVRITADSVVREGRVVDLRDTDIDGGVVVAAVSGEESPLSVESPRPTAVYDYCGHVRPGMGLQTRTALAAAARSRGVATPVDDDIADLHDELASFDSTPPTLPPLRSPAGDATVADHREVAATERGRLVARETVGADTDEARTAVREATRRLAERETERRAATQSRRRRREVARAYRDRMAERRRVADRLENRRREARDWLVEAFADRFETALAAVPGTTPTDPFEASPVPAALAVLRIAHTAAPVVVEVDRFETPRAAADALDAPVVRC